jgi:putative nucleotidyltransferase with HDIG domain
MNPQELVEKVEKLVALPDVCIKVNRLIDAPNYSAQTLGDLITQDTDLSARLLRLVNSAFFSQQAPVETISRAITVIGTGELRNLVMATSATRVFTGIPGDLVDMAEYWRYSMATGVIAGELAKQCNVLHTERLFVMGVLHDIGRLVIYLELPEISRDILLVTGGDDRILPEVEHEMLGFNHMEVGEALLRKWGLPESILTVVAYHHLPGKAKSYQLETALMHMASLISIGEMSGLDLEETCDDIQSAAWEITGLSSESIGPILEEVPHKVNEIMDVVLSPRLSVKKNQSS